jgi:hypothetical protein
VGDIREGDRVEFIGNPDPEDPDIPAPGERGWALDQVPTGGRPYAWIIAWDGGAAGVYEETEMRRVGQRNEPDPMKRLPGDPLGLNE